VALRRYAAAVRGWKRKNRVSRVRVGGGEKSTPNYCRCGPAIYPARCSSDFSRQITFLTIYPRDAADNRRLIKLLPHAHAVRIYTLIIITTCLNVR